MTTAKRSVLTVFTTFTMIVSAVPASSAGAPANSSAKEAPDMSNGADNFYKSDKVTVEKVTFKNKLNMNVVGNLFVPRNRDPDTKSAAVVVGHPMGAVKEQSADLYATKLAERGLVTL